MGLIRFKEWILRENNTKKFAQIIKEGTTVYFSDELAACYDLMISGFETNKKNIIIEFKSSYHDDYFLESAIDVWTNVADCEYWFIDNELQWIIIANKKGRTEYKHQELIKSENIDFEFKLNQIQ